MKSTSQHYRFPAYTVLELLVAIAIGILLVSIAVPSFERFRERARRAKCISHMSTIHTGLLAYLNDKGEWPQMEEGEFEFTEEKFFEFWVESTKPYGLSEETWVCPSDRNLERQINEDEQEYFGSCVVTRFDDKSQTPFRWNQPWAIERGNFHGKGAHMLMPDGSVTPSQNPFHGR